MRAKKLIKKSTSRSLIGTSRILHSKK